MLVPHNFFYTVFNVKKKRHGWLYCESSLSNFLLICVPLGEPKSTSFMLFIPLFSDPVESIKETSSEFKQFQKYVKITVFRNFDC